MTSGGPNYSTMFYALYLYNNAFKYHKMGKACAMAWILFIIIMILSALVMKVSAPMVYYEMMEMMEMMNNEKEIHCPFSRYAVILLFSILFLVPFSG